MNKQGIWEGGYGPGTIREEISDEVQKTRQIVRDRNVHVVNKMSMGFKKHIVQEFEGVEVKGFIRSQWRDQGRSCWLLELEVDGRERKPYFLGWVSDMNRDQAFRKAQEVFDIPEE